MIAGVRRCVVCFQVRDQHWFGILRRLGVMPHTFDPGERRSGLDRRAMPARTSGRRNAALGRRS